jgi:hypothetical protein
MWRTYPSGVARPGARDRVRPPARPVTTAYQSAVIQAANWRLDRDNDGISCERHAPPQSAPLPRPVTATASPSPVHPKVVPWVTAVHATPTTLTIAWGTSSGADRYRLSWIEQPGGRTWVGMPPDYVEYTHGPVTLTGLRPGHWYDVHVTPLRGDVAGYDGEMTAGTTSGL